MLSNTVHNYNFHSGIILYIVQAYNPLSSGATKTSLNSGAMDYKM